MSRARRPPQWLVADVGEEKARLRASLGGASRSARAELLRELRRRRDRAMRDRARYLRAERAFRREWGWLAASRKVAWAEVGRQMARARPQMSARAQARWEAMQRIHARARRSWAAREIYVEEAKRVHARLRRARWRGRGASEPELRVRRIQRERGERS